MGHPNDLLGGWNKDEPLNAFPEENNFEEYDTEEENEDFSSSDQISSTGWLRYIGGNYSRYMNIINDFTIAPPKDSGINLPELKTNLARTEYLLNRVLENPEKFPRCNHHIQLTALGCPKRGNDGKLDEEGMTRRSLQMACALLASEGPTNDTIAVHAASNNGHTALILSSDNMNSASIKQVGRGVYGRMEGCSASAPAPKAHRCYGHLTPIMRNKNEIKQEWPDPKKLVSWMTQVFSAAPANDFVISIQLKRIDGQSPVLQERIRALEAAYNELRFIGSVQMNSGINLSSNSQKLLKILSRTELKNNRTVSGQETTNGNIGLSAAAEQKRLLILAEEIEHELILLRQAQRSFAWQIMLSLSSDDEQTNDSIATLLQSAFEMQNYHLDWNNEPCASLMLNLKETAPLLMLPTIECDGLELIENEDFALCPPKAKAGDAVVPVGKVLWNGETTAPFDLPVQALNRHAFICGMTGAGKTNTLFRLIEQVNTPFLVIEPVKGEYRALRQSYPDMQVWSMNTAGDRRDGTQLLQVNPFWFPPRSSLTYHMDSLKTIIASAFEMEAAMPNILEQCISNIYVRCGWNPVSNRNIYENELPEEYLYPTFTDLCNELENYLNNSDFDGELLGNYKGAMLSRMKSFVNGSKGILLNNRKHPDYQAICSGHGILELEGLADDADKCLVMGVILIQFYQYYKQYMAGQSSDKRLRDLIIIEEAHRLFKATSPKSENKGGSNPTGQLVDMLSNIMAEIRAFGVGMLIIDQSPTKVSQDVIKNSATKIIHRIDNVDDIKVLQAALLLREDTTSLPSLSIGEALIRTDSMQKPAKVKIALSNIKEDYALSSSFTVAEQLDTSLENQFIATNLLLQPQIGEALEMALNRLINSWLMAPASSYPNISVLFISDVLNILKEYEVLELTGNQYETIIELLSIAVRRMFSNCSLRKQSVAHMAIMRCLKLCREATKGTFNKTGAMEMMRNYLLANVNAIFDLPAAFNPSDKLTAWCETYCQPIKGRVSYELHKYEELLAELHDEIDANSHTYDHLLYFLTTYTYLTTENVSPEIAAFFDTDE